jgi:hypothetical protein
VDASPYNYVVTVHLIGQASTVELDTVDYNVQVDITGDEADFFTSSVQSISTAQAFTIDETQLDIPYVLNCFDQYGADCDQADLTYTFSLADDTGLTTSSDPI